MKSSLPIRPPRHALPAVLIMCLIALSALTTPVLAASLDQAPPIPAGQSRVWFLRPLLPGEQFHPPMIYVNGAPITTIGEGTTFYRDFAPGQYAFTVENCLPQPGSGQTMTLSPGAQYALQVSQDDNGGWDCSPPQVSYLRQLQPQMAAYTFAPLTYLGAR